MLTKEMAGDVRKLLRDVKAVCIVEGFHSASCVLDAVVGDRHMSLQQPSSQPRLTVQTADVDQTRQVFGKLYSKVALEPTRSLPFSYATQVLSFGSIHVATDEWTGGGQLSTSAIGERYILSFAVEGTLEGTVGGEEIFGLPSRRGVLFSAQQPSTLTIGMRHVTRNIIIDRAALEAHLTMLTGQELDGPLCFSPDLDLTQCAGAAIYNLAQLLGREAERSIPSRQAIASLRDAIATALLTGQPHSAAELFGAPAPRVTPACVRRAEEYITAHAAEAISLEDIVAAVGVPARSLQASFQTYRGTTPMAFLRDRRFELARQRLLNADAQTTVVSVVRELGFGNPGRFSNEYKQRFGESPSDTLGRVLEVSRHRSKERQNAPSPNACT